MIKAVFLDIDGTMVSFRTHRVPDSAAFAVRRLREKGIKVYICTGRHMLFIDNLGDLEFDGYITVNGGYCTDSSGKCVHSRTIPVEDILKMKEILESGNAFPCTVVQENAAFVNFADGRLHEVLSLINLPAPPERPFSDALISPVYQMICVFDGKTEEQVIARMPGCETTRWHPYFADIVPKGSNKAEGIRKIITLEGICPEEIMAVGDGGNDISMLDFAGAGVAMGNADDEVKAHADYVTDTVDEDGIYNAMKHYGLLS